MAKNLFAQFLTAGKKVHFVHHGKPRFDKERKSELRQIFVFGLLAKPILERLAWGVKKKNAVQFKVHGTFSYFDSSGKRDFLLQ